MINMIRRVSTTIAATCGLMVLAACNMIGGNPSDNELKQCIGVTNDGGVTSSGYSVAAFVEGMKLKSGSSITWARSGNGYRMTRDRVDLGGQHQTFVFEFAPGDPTAKGEHCGPGLLVATGMAMNGEELNEMFLQQVVLGATEKGAEHLGLPPRGANYRPARTSDDVEQRAKAEAAQSDDQAEVDADREHYAQAAETALKRPIMITDDMTTYWCCLDLRQIVEHFRSRGAQATIDTADDGTVWLNVYDPKGSWQGWTKLEMEFVSPYSGGDQLRLSSIKNDGREVANINDSGAANTEQILRQMFKLRATDEPTP